MAYNTAPQDPGIDFILPNSAYLKEKKHKSKSNNRYQSAHGSCWSYTLLRSGFQATIYARNVTGEIIKARAERLKSKIEDNIFPIEEQMSIAVGYMNLRFWNIK